jgi:hypothetical protein
MVGAGLSGQVALRSIPTPTLQQSTLQQSSLQSLTIAPGVAPWVAGRMGLAYANEGGLTYTGSALRLDARHAFALGRSGAISLGLGASALMAQRPGVDQASGVYGGGADVPLLIGWRSTGGLYSFWFGPRGGFELFSGRTVLPDGSSAPPLVDVGGKHFFGGLTAGARVGFRHVHLALEVNASYHAADGKFSPSPPPSGPAQPPPGSSSSLQQISVTPAGALEVTF